jgi:hypothetical protein
MIRRSFRFLTAPVVEELAALQLSMMRREGDPTEISRNAIAAAMQPGALRNLSSSDISSLAAQSSVLFRPPPPELANALVVLFREELDSDDGVSLKAATAIIDATLNLSSTDEHVPLLQTAYATAIARFSYHGEFSARCAVTLLRCTFRLHRDRLDKNGGPSPLGEITPAAATRLLLPHVALRTSELVNEHCPDAKRLLAFLRSCEDVKRIDALQAVSVMADCGFRDTDVLDRCCDVFLQTKDIATSRQTARALLHVAMLAHDAAVHPQLAGTVNLRDLDAAALLCFVQAQALLGTSSVPGPSTDTLHNCVWMHAKRTAHRKEKPSPTEAKWLVDMAHALSVVGASNDKFTLHVSRTLRTAVHLMKQRTKLKLLFAVSNVGTTEIEASLQQDWERKVVKLRGILAFKVEEGAGACSLEEKQITAAALTV